MSNIATTQVDRARFLAMTFNEAVLPWHLGVHTHPFSQLIVVTRGCQHVRVAERIMVVKEGDILFFPRDTEHEQWADQPLQALALSFVWQECPGDVPLHLHDTGGRIRILAGWLHLERKAHFPLIQMQNQALLWAILAQFLKLWQHGDLGLLEDTRRYVQQRIAQTLTLDELAENAGISKYHFVRKYKALAGRTPMEDVRVLRVELARDLILGTSLPLKAIAPRVGLGSQYHLSRLFRRYLNMTPGEIRASTAGAFTGFEPLKQRTDWALA